MGRWAQRRLGGGGSPALIQMIHVEKTGSDTLVVTYSGVIDANEFENADFEDFGGGQFASGVAQDSPDKIELTFPDAVANNGQLNYAGDVLGILNPQSINWAP